MHILLKINKVVGIHFLLLLSLNRSGLQYLKKVKGNERFLVFASVSPHDPDKEKKRKEQIAAGCVGLKLHPILQNAEPSHRGYFEIMEIFRAYKMPVLFHSGVARYYVAYQPTRYGYGEPHRYEQLIKAFMDVPIIMGHMGMREGEQVIELARKYDNLYADSSQQRLSLLKNSSLTIIFFNSFLFLILLRN